MFGIPEIQPFPLSQPVVNRNKNRLNSGIVGKTYFHHRAVLLGGKTYPSSQLIERWEGKVLRWHALVAHDFVNLRDNVWMLGGDIGHFGYVGF